MPPTDRFVTSFAAEPPQEPLPYGRWADTLAGHFRAAVAELDTEGEDIGEIETEISWFPDRTYAGRTYIPAVARTAGGYELMGFVSFHEGASGPSDFEAQVDYTSELAESNPDWKVDLNDEVIGAWRGEQGKTADITLVWGVPLIAIAVLTMALAPRSKEPAATAPAQGRSWWPDWSNKLIWQIGFLFGSVNSVYFCSNAFLPGYLRGAGRADLISAALTALNFGQLPASFALLGVASRLERRAWPFIACGVLMLSCVAGIAATANLWTVFFAGLLGFLGAFVMTLGFGLPALLSAPVETARLSAAMFTISYSEALLTSVLSGAAWDLSGSARAAFLPIAVSALPLLFVPTLVRFHRLQHGNGTS